jgi:hypothetical protein
MHTRVGRHDSAFYRVTLQSRRNGGWVEEEEEEKGGCVSGGLFERMLPNEL